MIQNLNWWELSLQIWAGCSLVIYPCMVTQILATVHEKFRLGIWDQPEMGKAAMDDMTRKPLYHKESAKYRTKSKS